MEDMKYNTVMKGIIDTAFEDGEITKTKKIAKKMKAKGMEIDTIAEMTGLSKEEIEKL